MEPGMRPELDQWAQFCHRMRMHPAAADRWSSICVNPAHAMAVYTGSTLAAQCTFCVLFVGGFPWPTWRVLVPHMIMLLSTAAEVCGMYRFGPAYAASHVGRVIVLVLALTIAGLSVLCFFGPPTFVPFNNMIITTPLLFVAFFLTNLAARCGSMAANHPGEPHATLWKPLISAAALAIRGMNTLSDFAIAQSMVRKVRSCTSSSFTDCLH